MLALVLPPLAIATWQWFGGGGAQRTAHRSPPQGAPIATPTNDNAKTVRIIVASNSGTGELLGRSLRSDALAKGFQVELLDIAALPSTSSVSTAFGEGYGAVVLIAATYGEGEPTDSCKELHGLLKSSARDAINKSNEAGTGPLHGQHFAVFALGDTSYKYFARAGAEFADYIKLLGGQLLVPLQKGDAKHNMEESFEKWRESLWEPLATATGTDLLDSSSAPPRPEYEFGFRDDLTSSSSPFPLRPSSMEPTMKYPYAATVASKIVLVEGNTGDGTRRTIHLSFDITNAPIAYQAGDHLGIVPSNPDQAVNRCLRALKVAAADEIRVVELTTSAREKRRATRANVLPNYVTLHDALKWYVALTSPPKKATVRVLAKYCSSDAEKASITAALQSAEAFTAFAKKYRNVVDVLEAHPTCSIPVGHFLEVMPRIAPRYYSVASDMTVTPTSVDIVFVLSDGGLCTNMLNEAAIGSVVYLFVRHSTFHLSQAKKTAPVIMIGAGTGVAPYFGFAQRRSAWQKKNVPLGPCNLYFGCRRQAVDYLRREDWEAWRDAKTVDELRVAFSRDDPKSDVKYVQHAVAKDAVLLHQWMCKDNGFLFICGDAAGMAKEVDEVLKQRVLVEVGGLSAESAAQTISRWERTGRYLKDVWSSAA